MRAVRELLGLLLGLLALLGLLVNLFGLLEIDMGEWSANMEGRLNSSISSIEGRVGRVVGVAGIEKPQGVYIVLPILAKAFGVALSYGDCRIRVLLLRCSGFVLRSEEVTMLLSVTLRAKA